MFAKSIAVCMFSIPKQMMSGNICRMIYFENQNSLTQAVRYDDS